MKKGKHDVILASGILSIALLIMASPYMTSSALGGETTISVIAPGKLGLIGHQLAVTLPGDEDYSKALNLRTSADRSGKLLDESAAVNRKADPLLPPQKAMNLAENRYEEIESSSVFLSYIHPFALDLDPNRQMLVQRIETDYGISMVEDKTTATPRLIPSPAEGLYLFEDYDTVWILNAKTHKIEKITQDKVGGYDRASILKKVTDLDINFVWASQPKWSQDGSMIAYYSTRALLNKKSGEIWIADLHKKTERRIYAAKQWIGIYGWSSKGEIVFWEGSKGNIKIVNLNGIVVKNPLTQANHVNLNTAGNKLIYALTPKDYWLYDLLDGSKKQIAAVKGGMQFDPVSRFSPNGSKVVFLEYVGVKGERKASIYQLDTRKTTPVEIPASILITSTPEWINEETLLLTGKEKNKTHSWRIRVNGL